MIFETGIGTSNSKNEYLTIIRNQKKISVPISTKNHARCVQLQLANVFKIHVLIPLV